MKKKVKLEVTFESKIKRIVDGRDTYYLIEVTAKEAEGEMSIDGFDCYAETKAEATEKERAIMGSLVDSCYIGWD